MYRSSSTALRGTNPITIDKEISMLLERIYDEDLAQAGYLIGCQAKNEAMVVDARRDVRESGCLSAVDHVSP